MTTHGVFFQNVHAIWGVMNAIGKLIHQYVYNTHNNT